MKRMNLNRRDFHKFTMAAFGGMVAGTTIGCGEDKKENTTKETPKKDGGEKDVALNDWTGKDHVCRGLNACKNQGDTEIGENACRGRGNCATAKAHDCGTKNDCKYQGGCNGTAGQNSCKTEGGCHVPLNDDKWDAVREVFAAAMKKAGKDFGDAPPKG
jgi:hypothetical protein